LLYDFPTSAALQNFCCIATLWHNSCPAGQFWAECDMNGQPHWALPWLVLQENFCLFDALIETSRFQM